MRPSVSRRLFLALLLALGAPAADVELTGRIVGVHDGDTTTLDSRAGAAPVAA